MEFLIIYNLNKFKSVHNKVGPIIKIIGSIQKRTIELLIKTFINNYLYEEKITFIVCGFCYGFNC